MKVIKIETESSIYHVTIAYNWFERLFGHKPVEIIRYKDSWSNYKFGGGTIYITEKGEKTGNGDYIAEEIDKWRRRF